MKIFSLQKKDVKKYFFILLAHSEIIRTFVKQKLYDCEKKPNNINFKEMKKITTILSMVLLALSMSLTGCVNDMGVVELQVHYCDE